MIDKIKNYLGELNIGEVKEVIPLQSHVNEVYLIRLKNNRRIIFKNIKRSHKFKKIIYLQKLLLKNNVPVPKILHSSKNSPHFAGSVLIEEVVEGEKIDPKKISKNLLSSLAFFLAKIHSINENNFTNFSEKEYSSIDRFVLSLYEKDLEKIEKENILNNNQIKKVKYKLKYGTNFLKNNSIPKIIHGDLYPENILINGEIVVGIIDWENSMAFEPIMDFVKPYWWIFNNNWEMLEEFLKEYSKFRRIDSNFKIIFETCELLTILGYLTFAKETNQKELYSFIRQKLDKYL